MALTAVVPESLPMLIMTVTGFDRARQVHRRAARFETPAVAGDAGRLDLERLVIALKQINKAERAKDIVLLPSSLKTRSFPSPPHEGFGFIVGTCIC